jgi:hypothetical protein
MDTVADSHHRLASLLGVDAEPLEVLRRTEEHRNYWRPERVKVVLLAESHVYTTAAELDCTLTLPEAAARDIPRGFVRLVYCVGYGENSLLSRPIESPPNSGTPQFWKIFFSCAHPIASNHDFAPVQATMTAVNKRIANKLALLQRLRELGVWLLDASLAALYFPGRAKTNSALLEACLQTSWDHHVGRVLKAAAPSHVVCIGKGVAKGLRTRLGELDVPVTGLPQPNARLSSAKHFESFKTYYRIVREANTL